MCQFVFVLFRQLRTFFLLQKKKEKRQSITTLQLQSIILKLALTQQFFQLNSGISYGVMLITALYASVRTSSFMSVKKGLFRKPSRYLCALREVYRTSICLTSIWICMFIFSREIRVKMPQQLMVLKVDIRNGLSLIQGCSTGFRLFDCKK